MEKKKILIVLAIILGSIALIGGGVAFAYYLAGLTGNGNTADPVEMTTTSLGTIEYEGVTLYQPINMYPGEIGITSFTIKKGSQSGTGTYEIDLASVVDSVFGSDIEISLYKTTSSVNKVEVNEGTLVTSGDVAKVDELIVTGNPGLVYGPFVLTTNNKQILESVNFDTSTLADTTYYLVYHYKNDENNPQNNQIGHSFSGKVTVRLILGTDAYNLKVKYVYAHDETTEISTAYEMQVYSGASYSVSSPSLNYYTADRVSVSGTMNNNKEEVVKYTPIHDANNNGIADEEENHTLTILYKYNDDTTASTTYTASLAYNASYSVTSPTIDGYNVDTSLVSGTMGYEDRTIKVTYTPPALASVCTGENAAQCIFNNGLINARVEMAADEAGNVRYIGSDPNNYVLFNGEKWRIIGVFDVKKSAASSAEKRIKLVRSESIGNYSWDSSDGVSGDYGFGINGGYGVNEWSQADLMTELNTLYLNGQSGTCYNGQNNASTTCNFTSNGLNHGGSALIEDAVWNTGTAQDYFLVQSSTARDWYLAERSENTGKMCSSTGSGIRWCNDSVTRTTTWIGKVGLMYPSDYGYATGGGNGTNNRAWCLEYQLYGWEDSSYKTNCAETSWLYNSSVDQWNLTPSPMFDDAYSVTFISSFGNVTVNVAFAALAVRPVVYLKSSVKIKGGNGTSTTPYTLSAS